MTKVDKIYLLLYFVCVIAVVVFLFYADWYPRKKFIKTFGFEPRIKPQQYQTEQNMINLALKEKDYAVQMSRQKELRSIAENPLVSERERKCARKEVERCFRSLETAKYLAFRFGYSTKRNMDS